MVFSDLSLPNGELVNSVPNDSEESNLPELKNGVINITPNSLLIEITLTNACLPVGRFEMTRNNHPLIFTNNHQRPTIN